MSLEQQIQTDPNLTPSPADNTREIIQTQPLVKDENIVEPIKKDELNDIPLNVDLHLSNTTTQGGSGHITPTTPEKTQSLSTSPRQNVTTEDLNEVILGQTLQELELNNPNPKPIALDIKVDKVDDLLDVNNDSNLQIPLNPTTTANNKAEPPKPEEKKPDFFFGAGVPVKKPEEKKEPFSQPFVSNFGSKDDSFLPTFNSNLGKEPSSKPQTPAIRQPATHARPTQHSIPSSLNYPTSTEYNPQYTNTYIPFGYPQQQFNPNNSFQSSHFDSSGTGIPLQNPQDYRRSQNNPISYHSPQYSGDNNPQYVDLESSYNDDSLIPSNYSQQLGDRRPTSLSYRSGQYHHPVGQHTYTLSQDPEEEAIAAPTYVEFQAPKRNEEIGQLKIQFSSPRAAEPVANQIRKKEIPVPCKIELDAQDDSTIVLYVKNRSADDFKKLTNLKVGTFLVADTKTNKLMPCFKFEKNEDPQKFFEGIFGKKFDGQNFLSNLGPNSYAFTQKFFEHYAKPTSQSGLSFNFVTPSTNLQNTIPLSTPEFRPVVLEPRKTAAPAVKPITPPYVEFKAPTVKAAGSIEVTFKPEDVPAVLKQFGQLKENKFCNISRKNNTFSLTIANTPIENAKKSGTGIFVSEKPKTDQDQPKVAAMFKFETKEGRNAFMNLFGMKIDKNLVKTNPENKNIVMVTPEFFATQKTKKEETENKPAPVVVLPLSAKEIVIETKPEEKKEMFSFSFSSLLSKPKQPLPSYVIKPTNMEYKAPSDKEAGHIKVTFEPKDISAVTRQFSQLKESNVCKITRRENTFTLIITNNDIGLVQKAGVGLATMQVNTDKVTMPAFKFATEEGRDAFLKLFDLNIDDNLIVIPNKEDEPTTVLINPEFFSTKYPVPTVVAPQPSITLNPTNTNT